MPYARNARKHTRKQIELLRSSLAHYGWTNPMLIADNEMIAGHGRLAAAISMAHENEPIAGNADPWTGPTVDLSHLSEADRTAYRIADNKTALEAGWDNDLLKLEFDTLALTGFDLSLTGFAAVDIETLRGIGHTSKRGLRDGLTYQVVIDCADEADQARMLERFRAEGLGCKPLIL